jgi:ATP-dependent helicase/nuclease subunit B
MLSETQSKTTTAVPPISFLDSLVFQMKNGFGNNLLRVLVLMPNSRGGFYLKESFKKLAKGDSVVLPKTLSLDKWVSTNWPLQIVGEQEAVFYLFQSFRRFKNPEENIEEFYPLGQNLYADFEEIIRNEVSIPHVYTALERWESTGLGFADFLDSDQKKLLANFWANFETPNGHLTRRMVELWKAIPAVFADYERSLKNDGKCTAAMAYAGFSKELPPNSYEDFDSVYFVGFGELTATERRLIRSLKAKIQVNLIWDFNESYLQSPQHEVNRLIQRLKRDFDLRESLEKAMENTVLPSRPEMEIIQCQGLEGMSQLINKFALNLPTTERIGLIILEPALVQVLAQNAGSGEFPYNISMGFPLLSTPEAVELLLRMEAWNVDSNSASSHSKDFFPGSPWIKDSGNPSKIHPDWIHAHHPLKGLELLKEWLVKIQTIFPESTYDQQVWALISDAVEELWRLLQLAGEQNPTSAFVGRLAKSLFASRTLKMDGDPDRGIQVMGLYESRLLDFDWVIIAPATDALLPSSSIQNSLLPDSLRRAFGLLSRSQTCEDEMYQAWRLTHRSKKVTILVSGEADSKPSRFVDQLIYNEGFSVSQFRQDFGSSLPMPHSDEVAKNEFIRERLDRFSSVSGQPEMASFSPSSLHALMQCQLKFYYSHILKLKKPEEGAESGMDVRDFGNWVHGSIQEALHLWQKDKTGSQPANANQLIRIWNEISELIWDNQENKVSPGNLSDFFVEKEVGAVMAIRFFRNLETLKPFRWRANELKLNRAYLLDSQDENRKWGVEGRADLVLELENETILLDLKTGSFSNESDYILNHTKLDGLQNKLLKNKDLFQMLMYNWVVWKNRNQGGQDEFRDRVRARLFYLADPKASQIDPTKNLHQPEQIELVFAKLEEILDGILSELFDYKMPFRRTEEISHCQFCDFNGICQR